MPARAAEEPRRGRSQSVRAGCANCYTWLAAANLSPRSLTRLFKDGLTKRSLRVYRKSGSSVFLAKRHLQRNVRSSKPLLRKAYTRDAYAPLLSHFISWSCADHTPVRRQNFISKSRSRAPPMLLERLPEVQSAIVCLFFVCLALGLL